MKIISIIFLILFIFLTLGIIGFYFYNRNTQSIVTTNIVTSTSTSTNSYGNYKNYQYGFEIKYPSQFDVIEGTTPEHPYVDFDYKSLEPDADFEQATFSIIISTSTKDCLFEGLSQLLCWSK